MPLGDSLTYGLAVKTGQLLLVLTLSLVLWYLVAGSILNRTIVNPRRIAREADSYAVRADEDVRRSIELADSLFERSEITGHDVVNLDIGLGPLMEYRDPYEENVQRVTLVPETTAESRPLAVVPPEARVAGVGGRAGDYFAVIERDGVSRIYRVGERLSDWQIIRITNDHVIVARGQKSAALDWKGD